MTTPERLHRKAAALWGGGAVVVAAVGAGTVIWSTSSGAIAAPPSGGSASTTGGNGQGNNGKGGGNGAGTGAPGKALTVTASASGRLAPGVDDELVVRVTNPNRSAIDVTRVTGSITGVTELASATGPTACSSSWYSVADFVGATRIAGGATGEVTMRVSFSNEDAVNQDRCKGATYAFRFTATAEQVVTR